ncbi:MAG TPA: NAD(P) transhydrogenase subunit alpha [Rubrobacteraceae bacterium]|nr:NAD(P) transhydrogenase subunit alpha [Rubrobacteraceae bacterium]
MPRETVEGERRVGLVPETVGRLAKEGFEVVVESGAGRDYNLDENYEEAGASVVEDAGEVYGAADLIVKVASPTEEEIGQMRAGQILVCFLNGPGEPELVRKLADAGVTVFSNEAVPRTSVAQSMDALSSMGSIAGYKCALIAADSLGKYVPMLSTAAGTTKAANVLVFGVAVAGLQAIAIMNRLGGEVFAYDIRPETKEQAQSLGASFIDSEDENESDEQEDGWEEYEPEGFHRLMASLGFHSFAEPPRDRYIVEGEEEPEGDVGEEEGWSQEKLDEDQKLLRERIKEMDIVITTALVPGRPAPQLVDREMVESMKPGSVIVDLAAESGGNCELTEPGETIMHNQVEIIGPLNLPSAMPIHASQLYSRNMHNLIGHITEDRSEDKDEHDLHPNLDFEDEIIGSMCIAHDGEVRDEATLEALESASAESD